MFLPAAAVVGLVVVFHFVSGMYQPLLGPEWVTRCPIGFSVSDVNNPFENWGIARVETFE